MGCWACAGVRHPARLIVVVTICAWGFVSDRLLTKSQVADALQVSVRTVDNIRADGDLVAVKVRGSVRFPESVLISYIGQQTARAATSGGES